MFCSSWDVTHTQYVEENASGSAPDSGRGRRKGGISANTLTRSESHATVPVEGMNELELT